MTPLKSLLRSLLVLAGLAAIAVMLVLLVALFYHVNPSQSSEGGAWASIGDSMAIAVSAVMFGLAAISVWIVFQVRVIYQVRTQPSLRLAHIGLLIAVIITLFYLRSQIILF